MYETVLLYTYFRHFPHMNNPTELGWSGDVTVVDSMPGPASQASGKAGGFLARGWSSTHQFDDLTRLSYSLHQKLSSELGCDTIGYRPLTTLSLDIQQDCHHKEGGFLFWCVQHVFVAYKDFFLEKKREKILQKRG